MSFFGTVMKFQFIKPTLRVLISELLKSLDDLNLEFTWSYFVFKRSFPQITSVKSICCDISLVFKAGLTEQFFRTAGLQNSLPQFVKYNESILELKTKMKNLGNIDCSCILYWWIVKRIKVLFIQYPLDA